MAAASPRTARRTSSTRSCATTRSRRERSGARMVGLAGQAAAHALSSGGTSPRATYSLYVRSRFLCSSAAICASSDGAASSLLAMLERRTPLRTAALPNAARAVIPPGDLGEIRLGTHSPGLLIRSPCVADASSIRGHAPAVRAHAALGRFGGAHRRAVRGAGFGCSAVFTTVRECLRRVRALPCRPIPQRDVDTGRVSTVPRAGR